MSAKFQEGDSVVVTEPTPRHAHTKGWEGKIGRKAKGGCWYVVFLGGWGLYHASEIEPDWKATAQGRA